MIQDLYTPPELVAPALAVLGGIDLDPASDHSGRSRIPAAACFTLAEDGLAQPWPGRVWLFPPQDGRMAAWVAKLIHEHRYGRTMAALLYTRLDARSPWWGHLASEASICFVAGALRALKEDGTPLPRSRLAAVLAYLGPDRERFRAVAGGLGAVMEPAP